MKNTKQSWYKRLGWTGIALCGLCCTLPLIGAAISMGSLTILSIYFERIGILSLGLSAFLFWYGWYNKRKNAKACMTTCDTTCDCKQE